MAEHEKPVGKEYVGPSGIARDSQWLTSEDLIEGRDAEATVARVILYPKVTFEAGRTKENMVGLEFVGKQRVLGLNATNRKTMNAMFGNITSQWKGKSITLFVTDTLMKGESVKCVRIRNKGSRVATAAEQFLEDENDPKPTGTPDSAEREQLDLDNK
jgi:hypothetical protein